MYNVIIDAGHGGEDFGATYNGRMEKTDNLNLALAVGQILQENGVNVEYTRTTDVYDTPYEKAVMANNSGADFFVSIHRNALPTPNTGTGVETLVYDNSGIKAEMAQNINNNLSKLGFINRGVIPRPNLVVLKRTKMPAVLVEAGFIDNEADNAKFDAMFWDIAQAIADGILETLDMQPAALNDNSSDASSLYRIQVGAYRNQNLAQTLAQDLQNQGFDAYVQYNNGIYRVQAGAFDNLDEAVAYERKLMQYGYDTLLTK